MGIFGVICCSALILFSKSAAELIIPDTIAADQYAYYVSTTQTVLVIVAFALLFVPILSFYRGFYQGLRDLRVYAKTQVLEQLIRISFLLGAGAFCVYILHLEQIWSVYMATVSTSLAAVGTIVYFVIYDRRNLNEMVTPPQAGAVSRSSREIFKEFMSFAVPYLTAAIITNSGSIFVLLMFSTGMQAYGTPGVEITVLQGLIDYQAAKLTMIPQIFASGFSLALIPHITTALTLGDEKGARQLISKALVTVNYLAIPIIIFMALFAKEIFYIMYGNYYLADGASILSKCLVLMLLFIIVSVLQSIMLSLRMHKQYIFIDCAELLLVIVSFEPALASLGVNGYFVVYSAKYLIFIVIATYLIIKRTGLRLRPIFEKVTEAFVGCLPMLLLVAVLNWGNYDITSGSRLVTTAITGVLALSCMAAYLYITGKFNLPQQYLDLQPSFGGLVSKVKELVHKN